MKVKRNVDMNVKTELRKLLRSNIPMSNDDILIIKQLVAKKSLKKIPYDRALNLINRYSFAYNKFNTYKQYLNSDTWRQKKELYYLKTGKYCKYCKSTENLNVHHKKYTGWGNESLTDLISLCKQCHKQTHSNKTPDKEVKRIRDASKIKWTYINIKAKKLINCPHLSLEDNEFINKMAVLARPTEKQTKYFYHLWYKNKDHVN